MYELGEIGHRPEPFERDDLGAMHVAAIADLLGDAADLERMRMRLSFRHEAADSGDAHQNALIAQLAHDLSVATRISCIDRYRQLNSEALIWRMISRLAKLSPTKRRPYADLQHSSSQEPIV